MSRKILKDVLSSSVLQSAVIWFTIFLILFIQPLWISTKLSLLIASSAISSMLAVYYVNRLVLIPKLLLRGKKIGYIIFSLLMIIPLAYSSARIEMAALTFIDIKPEFEFRLVFSVSRSLTFYILTYAVSSIIFFSKKATEDAKLKEELLSEKKMLEVRVLKSQINSHFIFNALNNIYSMIYFKDEYISGYVLKLAQMMRYVMDDCVTELTPLSKEIEYIENFIDFQKLRFENDRDIIFTCNINENTLITIPPMIFQPLIENCFKHAPLESFVHISLIVKENGIYFVTENSQPLMKKKMDADAKGIGLENVKRRLNLYYNNHYTFDVSNNTNIFKVELFIDMKS